VLTWGVSVIRAGEIPCASSPHWVQQEARIFHAQLAGQDGYEGWTTLLDDLCVCDTPTSEMKGAIIPGDLPAAE
jgi:hypothetical protein